MLTTAHIVGLVALAGIFLMVLVMLVVEAACEIVARWREDRGNK